jgi:hypothetical protein
MRAPVLLVMLNLFQHNALPLVILKQVQDDETLVGGLN